MDGLATRRIAEAMRHDAAFRAHPAQYSLRIVPVVRQLARDLLDAAGRCSLLAAVDHGGSGNGARWTADIPSEAWARWWLRQMDLLPNDTMRDLPPDVLRALLAHTMPEEHAASGLALTRAEAGLVLPAVEEKDETVDDIIYASVAPRQPPREDGDDDSVVPTAREDRLFGELEAALGHALRQAAQADKQLRDTLVLHAAQTATGAVRRDVGAGAGALDVLLREYGRSVDVAGEWVHEWMVALVDGYPQ